MKAFVAALLDILHTQAIPYAIGGSVASSYYGEARTTLDIDLSIVLDDATADQFAAACEARDWYVSREAIRQAIASGDTFSVNDGFWKADCFVIGDDAFALAAFQRRRQAAYVLAGQRAWFLAPEDVIVHKLRWVEGKPLDKHVRDITAILHKWYGDLDLAYITRWAAAFDAGELWAGILDTFRRSRDG